MYVYTPWKSKDYLLNGFSEKTIILVGIFIDWNPIYIYTLGFQRPLNKWSFGKGYEKSIFL